MATHSSILAGKSPGQKNVAGNSPWGHKELDTTERLTHTIFYGFFHVIVKYVSKSAFANIQDK